MRIEADKVFAKGTKYRPSKASRDGAFLNTFYGVINLTVFP